MLIQATAFMRKTPEYGLGRIIAAIKPAARWPLAVGFFIGQNLETRCYSDSLHDGGVVELDKPIL